MGKKKEYTPNSQIKSALRKLFLRSRERAARLKKDKYTCCSCGAKQSRAKGKEVYVNVHHLEGIENWQEIYNVIRKNLLCSPDKMQTLCVACHKKQEPTNKKKEEG